jgi:hypothetical protein
METLTNVIPFALLGTAIAVALWAWYEIRDVAMGRGDIHAPQRLSDSRDR